MGVTLLGHISLDIIRIPNQPERRQPGGTVYYAGMALRALGVPTNIITRLAKQDEETLLAPLLQAGASITALPSTHTTGFINSYGPGTDEREQEVTAQADPFTRDDMPHISTQWIYLAPLLEGDISMALFRQCAGEGKHLIALDAQGMLRRVVNGKVTPAGWPDKYEILPHIDILKAGAEEAERITGQSNPEMAARILCGRGVDHALVTLGGAGAIICHRGALIRQPVYRPIGQDWPVMDTTGCGDTFLAAYLASIIEGRSAPEAGRFAAIAAALKLTRYGPLDSAMVQIARAFT